MGRPHRNGSVSKLLTGLLLAWASATAAQPIDRPALVARHDPVLASIDPHAPIMLGNGEIGFTADITGLQTFPEQYAATSPLLIMAQWAWHSFPNPHRYSEADGLTPVAVPGRGTQNFAYMSSFAEAKNRPAFGWLRDNPHRISLGRVALSLRGPDGKPARFEDLAATRQRLDLWRGALFSSFTFAGQPVSVETRVDPRRDMVVAFIRSPLVASGRFGVDVRYPGVAANVNPDPSDFAHPDSHRTSIVASRDGAVVLRNQIDGTAYFSAIVAKGARVTRTGAHDFHIARSSGDTLTVFVSFDRARLAPPSADLAGAIAATDRHWRDYWMRGGMIDFSGSSDPRAPELERRVVLSQYLAAINEAGDIPPQEEGLFSNSWSGKFHLEMHAWHSAHFAAWGRPEMLARSMGWYLGELPRAMAEARRHGVQGAWWPKSSGPEGRNVPSPISPFIMWQQPNPIYLAEMLYRDHPGDAILRRYGNLVEQTAKLLASWPRHDAASGRYVLGPPIIPVQENHPAMSTSNPVFEIAYFRWGLETAQLWRVRRGLARNPQWDAVIAGLGPLPQRGGLYLPVSSEPDFWTDTASAACRGTAAAPQCRNRDHPSFLMAYGLIGSRLADRATMARTLASTARDWDWRQTWGWDFPMVAMTAARLGEREAAIDWLFKPATNNQWGLTGMTPRVNLDTSATGGPDGIGFARAADTYFPSNGSLLLAVGMMAAGWDGSHGAAPGFPPGWKVTAEGIRPLP